MAHKGSGPRKRINENRLKSECFIVDGIAYAVKDKGLGDIKDLDLDLMKEMDDFELENQIKTTAAEATLALHMFVMQDEHAETESEHVAAQANDEGDSAGAA